MTDTTVSLLDARRDALLDEITTLSSPESRSADATPDRLDAALDRLASVERARDALRARESQVRVVSEPLTYRKDARASYFQDWLLTEVNRPAPSGAAERLQRHAQEMDVLREVTEEAAIRKLDAAGFEYRLEPNTTDGYGGYFAPPLWVNQLFAPGKHAQRVLADLIPARFALPPGVSSINLPILKTGAIVDPVANNQGVPEQDIADSAGSSAVVTLVGNIDVPLQMLEQSPPGAHLDWAMFTEMSAAYGAGLESQLITGAGQSSLQLLGVASGTNFTAITYTSASPAGTAMWPYFGYAVGQIGDSREVPPEAWLMRTARWAWFQGAEDLQNRPFGLPSPFFLGNTDDTPDPIGGLFGLPVFLDDSIPATLGTGANQDEIICLRPSDLILLEGDFQTAVDTQVLSGSLGARLQLRNNVAAITNRYTTGTAVLGGTGFVVQSNY